MKNALDRFMEKVNKTDGCWLWTGTRSGSGYGQFWFCGKLVPAHHFLLEEAPEKRKLGLFGCHHCDNRLCVRPSHIFWGTASDNMKDCVSKGRLNNLNGCTAMLKVRKMRLGEAHHDCKLTVAQVIEAKNCPRVHGAASAMARRFGVDPSVICGIRNGKRWKHIA